MFCTWTEFLTPADIEAIHTASMQLLAEVGIRFSQPEALAVFQKHGCRVEGQTVYLTEPQVMAAVQQAPARFTLHARNPARTVTVGGGAPVFAPAYGAPFLADPQTGKRTPTMEDYHNLSRLAHALPHQDLSGHLMVEVDDVVATGAYLHMIYANIIHSDKPFMGSMAGAAGARRTMQMAEILFGEPIDKRPVTIGLADSLSPLSYGDEMVAAIMEYARCRQPLILANVIMAGATGPITLGGVLVQQNAEVLVGLTLTQLISPGTPVIYGSASTIMDMRTGMPAIGSPELGQLVVASAQLARYYGLPSRGGGALTDANSPDAQAGYESMFGLLAAVNSGTDFVLHAAGILSSYLAFSYEKFVLDDEMCGMVRRYRQGLTVSPDTLAYEVIANVGSGGHFLLEQHTVQRCRTEFWQPALNDRYGMETWLGDGRPNFAERAQRRWQELLAAHQDPPLEAVTLRQLRNFVEENSSVDSLVGEV